MSAMQFACRCQAGYSRSVVHGFDVGTDVSLHPFSLPALRCPGPPDLPASLKMKRLKPAERPPESCDQPL